MRENCKYYNDCGNAENCQLCSGYEIETKDIKRQIPWERMSEIATQALQGLLEDDYDSAMEYFKDTIELTEEERDYFGIPTENNDVSDESESFETELEMLLRLN